MAHVLSPSGVALRADRRTFVTHARAGASAGGTGLALDRRMVLAVTSRRLLIIRSGGAFTPRATDLLGQVPVGDVDAIEVAAKGLVKPVTIRVRGSAVEVEIARGHPAEDLPGALARAHAAEGRAAL